MGIPVLILGESGSGKSASLRNFEPEKVGIFNVAGKPLPFRKKMLVVNNARYDDIYRSLAKGKLKSYVIDDSQYLMAFEELDRAKETGYTKFTEMALNFSGLVRYIINMLPADTIVYFLHHVETSETGKVKAKTVGKMIDSKLTLEGLFSIVLLCETSSDGHHFITQSDGYTTAKSPMEMFELEIDNDLAMVDATIREYWNLGGNEE
ncbi:MAG: AAA family ATPase [Oscillospiraceae bacterium]|nr:AAA family ATPase [Oscillospiraceae bacterium]